MKMEEPLEFHRVYYDADGNKTEEEYNTCAKQLISNRTGNVIFYVKSTTKELFNPLIRNFNYSKNNWKFLKVPVAKFNLYISFLKTKNVRYLTQAERL